MVESNGHDRSEAPRRRRARIPWVSDSGLGYALGIRVDKNNALYACVHRPRKRERQREKEGGKEEEGEKGRDRPPLRHTGAKRTRKSNGPDLSLRG